MTLAPEHEQIIGRGISKLPLSVRDDAVRYVESVLRPIREVTDSDVRHATAAALVKYRS